MRLKFWMPLLCVVLAWFAPSAQAQSYRWSNVAIGGGGFVTSIIPSKTQRGLFYARTDVGGAYRWDNANARWVPLLDGLSEADTGLMSIDALALDRNNSAVVYVLAGVPYFSNGKSVVMRSTDYGTSWSRITDVSHLFRVHGNGLGRGNGEKMQVDPGNSNIVYIGSRTNGLFKSTDAGASFARVGALPVTTTPNESGISFVLLDPSSVVNGVAQRVFVGVSRFGSIGPSFYRSDNAGASFYAVPNAPGGTIPQRAALAGDGHLYVTYANGSGPQGDWKTLNPPEPMDTGQVWKYHVATGAWINVTPAGITKPFSGVSVDPQNPQRLIISTINTWMQQGSAYGDHFFTTVNGGSTWTDVVSRGFAFNTGGVSWVAGHSIHWAGSIEFDPFNTSAVWVTSGNGIFRNANIDATVGTWTFTVKGLEEVVPLAAVSVPGGPLLSTIGDYDGFRHTNIDAYAPIHTPQIGTTTGLTVAPAATSIVVRVGDKMYRSSDTGVNWSEVTGLMGTKGTVVLSANGTALLHTVTDANGNAATYRSTNFTSTSPTWARVGGLSSSVVRPVADPVNANKFYVYDNGTVRVSTNGGVSFTTAAALATGGSTLLRAAPGREGDVWVALKGGGLARSTNSGSTFSTIADITYCGAVGFGKAISGASYPAVYIWGSVDGGPRGIYRSADAGANWARINDDAHQFGGPGNGEFVIGDMNTEGVVYMSSAGRGIVYGAPVTATRLLARHSGKCLDVPGASTSSGIALKQYTCNTGNNQKWTFEVAGAGYLRVKVSHSGMCMDLASQSTANSVSIVQASCNSNTSQQWTKEDMGSGWFRIKSRFSGRCLDVNGVSTADNASIIQYACGTGLNQQWANN